MTDIIYDYHAIASLMLGEHRPPAKPPVPCIVPATPAPGEPATWRILRRGVPLPTPPISDLEARETQAVLHAWKEIDRLRLIPSLCSICDGRRKITWRTGDVTPCPGCMPS